MLPASVDLRSELDTVYNQDADRSCGPHAVANALDCMYDRAGQSRRHSRAFTWWWSQFWLGGYGAINDRVGSTYESLSRSLLTNGTMTDAEWAEWLKAGANVPTSKGSVPSITLVRSQISSLDDIKRRLAMGVPVLVLLVIYDSFYALRGDWKTHRWQSNTPRLGEHFVSIVGYDDAAERFLIENSWDASWGDGGFFGMPYDMAFDPNVQQGYGHIDRIPGLTPKPADHYIPEAPMYLTVMESSAFATRSQDALRDTLLAAFSANGPAGLVTEMARWGVSDKHVEVLAGWPRGTVRSFATDHASLDWSKQVWDQI